jgi:hypothetical protein
VKNHVYFMIFILSLVVGVLIFDYLVWTRKYDTTPTLSYLTARV